MRVQLVANELPDPLAKQFPIAGTILHPESNRSEWAIISLDHPVEHLGGQFSMLTLHPRRRGDVVGDAPPITVNMAVVNNARIDDSGRRFFSVDDILGLATCVPIES